MLQLHCLNCNKVFFCDVPVKEARYTCTCNCCMTIKVVSEDLKVYEVAKIVLAPAHPQPDF